MKFMTLPNVMVGLLAITFIVSGPFVLPFDDYLWRVLIGVIALTLGFLIHFTGVMGGGDLKLIAAMLPFVAYQDLIAFAFLMSIMTLAGVAAHRFVGWAGYAPEGWKSWEGRKKFPFGLSLAGTLIFYLGLQVYTAYLTI
ncbi:MAG: hypothetical protein JKY31_05360 [Rhodobacteraceae bacterium]|nr:hypothetical protein [Paracoccaceae bacterium]